jgi:hypothetical protein
MTEQELRRLRELLDKLIETTPRGDQLSYELLNRAAYVRAEVDARLLGSR